MSAISAMTLSSFLKSGHAQQPHYVLFGHPVGHSLSPPMHNTALKYYGMPGRYYAVDLQPNELERLASYLNWDSFRGANITIPYKQMIGDYLDDIDPTAQSIGALNTIVKDSGRLRGLNTDLFGFKAPLREHSDKLEGGRGLIFGTGGASRAVVTALIELGMEELYLVSRDPQKVQSYNAMDRVGVIAYSQWPAYAEEAALLVNATPLGMAPRTEASPVNDQDRHFLAGRICYDLVYNPLETTFLGQAKSEGATTIGGLEMLIQQGSRSFEYWTGKPFPAEHIRTLLYEKLRQ